MKALAILTILILFLSAFSTSIWNVHAAGYGLSPDLSARMKAGAQAKIQGNSTEDFISQYSDQRMPSYSERARMSSLSPQVLIEILAAVIIASLAAYAAYLHRSERSPEQTLKEPAKLTDR